MQIIKDSNFRLIVEVGSAVFMHTFIEVTVFVKQSVKHDVPLFFVSHFFVLNCLITNFNPKLIITWRACD